MYPPKYLGIISKGPRCGRCRFEESPRSYMRDDTVCEKCSGTEGPAIIAASVLVPIFLVGVPLVVMRLERTRVYAYRLYVAQGELPERYQNSEMACLAGTIVGLISASSRSCG